MTIEEASERLDRIKADAEARKDDFTIVFCGVFSSGKSSVLNYFLNLEDFLSLSEISRSQSSSRGSVMAIRSVFSTESTITEQNATLARNSLNG